MDFKLPDVSNGQLYKEAGNSVVVPVIRRIAENIAEALNNATDDFDIKINEKKYALIYLNIKRRSEGKSYIEEYFDSKSKLSEYVENKKIKVFSSEEYLNVIQKNKFGNFYMIIEI